MDRPVIIPPQTVGTAALIVTYNPDERLVLLVKKLLNQNLPVFIVDNASNEENSAIQQIQSFSEISLLRNNTNFGIGMALNSGIQEIIKRGFSWVLQFDQDSIPENDFAKKMFAHWKVNPLSPVLLGCGHELTDGIPMKQFISTCTVITSGSLLNLEVFKFAGPYRADFFIDGIDFEYALRLKSLGFATGITRYAAIDHRIGTLETNNALIGWLKPTHHNAIRRYYRSRNLMILTRLYLTKFPIFILKYHFFHFISIIVLLFSDNDRTKKFKAVLKGCKDGLFFKK